MKRKRRTYIRYDMHHVYYCPSGHFSRFAFLCIYIFVDGADDFFFLSTPKKSHRIGAPYKLPLFVYERYIISNFIFLQ